MGETFVDSLRNFLQQTGYEDIDSIIDYYGATTHEDGGICSILEFLNSQITEDNLMRKEHLQVAEKLKVENIFLDEAKINKKLKYASQLDALPPITEVDIDCCKSELFELKKQSEVLQNLKDCLNIEFEELKKNSEVIQQKKIKCDANLNRTMDQCTELYARYDSVYESANNSFNLHRNSLKDISLNKKLKKDFLFQITDDASLRMNSTVLRKSLLKLARKIGFSPQTSDLNTTLQSNNSFSQEVYNRIFKTEESNFIDEFEKNKLELKLFCARLQNVSHMKSMEFIEKDSFSTVLELLRKMNSDIEEGSLQLAALKEDMQDIAQGSSELPAGWGDENSTDELTSAVDVVCGEWMKSQMLQHLLNRLEQRAKRRELLLEQLNAFTKLLQTCLVFDDMLWMLLVSEKNCILSFIQDYKSTMHQSSKELAGFKQRMKLMEKMLKNNSIKQHDVSLCCIGEMLSTEKFSINKICTAIDESIKSFDGVGSKFLGQISKLSKILDNRCKDITSFNKFILRESGNFTSDDDDNEISNIQSRIDQLVENIEIVSKLVDDKKKYFESKPFEKDYTLAWALFLTNKEKLKEIVDEIEREARNIKGSSIT